MSDVLNDLRNQNANLPTEKKQNIIVVQDTGAGSEDKTGQMLTVLNSIFNAVSEQLRLTRESLNLQKQDRLEAKDFQKEAMDVSSGKYEPPEYSSGGGSGGGGGTASSAGEGGGIAGTVGKVGGGLWEGVKGIGKSIAGVAARHPIGTAIGVGAAAGLGVKKGLDYIASKKERESGMESALKYSGGNIQGLSDAQTRALVATTAKTESSGNLSTINKYGYAGQYQFGAEALKAVGLLKKGVPGGYKTQKSIMANPENWTIKGGLQEFLSNREIQDKAFRDLAEQNINYGIRTKALTANSSPEDIAGFVKSAHLLGAGRAKNFYKSGINYTDAFGTSAKLYTNQAKEAVRNLTPEIERRMSKSENIDRQPNGTATKLTSNDNQPNIQPTATKMVDTSDLRVKGGLKGQAFKGGETEQGIVNLARTIQADEANLPGGLNRFSSFNDAYHLKANPKSKHTQGLAMDFSLKNAKYSSEAADYIKQKLLSSGMTEEDFKIINEYKRPSKHATGGHIHVNFTNKQAAEKFAQYSSGEGQQTKLASNEQLPKTGRHKLERTDEKSGVLQASMFAPLQTAFDRMTNILEKIAGNTKDTKDEVKASRTEDKDSPSASKVTPENPEKGYTATDFLDEEGKKKYEEAKQKALNDTLKTGKEGIDEDDIAKQMSDEDRDKFNTARQKAKEAGSLPTASPVGNEEDMLSKSLSGNDEGSNVMKMLFGQGGWINGSAEPIEPGSPKRQFLDSLPTYGDKLGEYVKNLLLGGGDVSEEGLQGALQAIGEEDTSGVMKGLLGMGGTATPQGTGDELKNLGITPMSGTEQFLNNLGITPYANSNKQQENQLTAQKGNQLSNMGVTGFGDALKSFGGFNNPFSSMQSILGQVGSMVSIGQNMGGMMKQGGLGGVQGVMGQMGGILSGMGQGFPMMQGIGGMLGQAGNMIGAVRGFENIGRGGMGGVMGGIGAASSVLGSLGNVFGGMQRMGGGLSGMGVTPFGEAQGMLGGLGGMVNTAGSIGNMIGGFGGGIGQGINAASGIMGAAGGLMNTATSLGGSLGGMFGNIGDSLGGLFGTGDASTQKGNEIASAAKSFFGGDGTSSMGIGDDAAAINSKYSDLTTDQTGQNLESLQSSNDSLSSMPSGGGGSSGTSSSTQGRNGAAPADVGTMGTSMGASGGAGFKSGDKRAGTSAGAMGNSMNPYNNCNVLFQWLYRNMWWAKV